MNSDHVTMLLRSVSEWNQWRAADLSSANLSGSNLRQANLRGSDLSGSDLSGSDLRYACLNGAKIDDYTIIKLAARLTRSDGYEFFGWLTDKGLLIRAGCQTKTLTEYREHVLTYENDAKIRETMRILDYIEGSV